MATSWINVGSVKVTKDSRYKHYFRPTISASATIPSIGSSLSNVYWYMDGGSQHELARGYYSNYVMSDTVKYSGSSISWYVIADTYYNITNASARYNYTTKAVPTITSNVNGTFFKFNVDNEISFNVGYISGIDEQYTIKSGTLYYKTDDGSYLEISFTGNKVIIPANTLVSGKEYTLYAKCVMDDDSQYNSNEFTVSTVDAIGSCVALEPINQITYNDVTFRWNYSNKYGMLPTAFDIQISSNDGESYEMIADHINSSASEYSIKISGSGNKKWQVRAYNQDNVASDWSDPVEFVNNVPPDPPMITSVSGIGRKMVKWSSDEQIGYQVIVEADNNIVFDSGTVYSSDKSYIINEYLYEGTYQIKARVINIYGKYSEYASADINVTYELPLPEFQIIDNGAGVNISITKNNQIDWYYVKRNGIVIARVDSTIYVDNFVNGKSNYELIAVATDDRYSILAKESYSIYNKTSLLTANGESIVCNHRFGNRLEPQTEISPEFSSFNYLGAKKPIHIFSDLRSMKFSIDTTDKNNSFSDFIGVPLFYANRKGESSWVMITSINRKNTWYGNDTQLILEATNYDEEIEYDL